MSKNNIRLHKKKRIRAKVSGTSSCPRLSIFRSLENMYIQIIDDENGKTLLSANLKEASAKNNIEGAKKIGKLIADKCKKAYIGTIVFDRSGYKYHGKVKAIAEEARKNGLKF
jgi:large subunit ribosomal protein L18